MNRGKRSIAIDMRSDRGRKLLRSLALDADVLVENFRPGVLADMGLDPDSLEQENPGLVVMSISGFGPVGPDQFAPGLDQVAQGMSGLMSVTGAGEQTPMRVGIPIIDTVSGIYAALGITAALASRGRDGRGHRVQTSLLESAISIMTFQAQDYLSTGRVSTPNGNTHPTITPYALSTLPTSRSTLPPARTSTGSHCARYSATPSSPSVPNMPRVKNVWRTETN